MFESINPYNNEIIFVRDFDSDQALLQKLDRAHSAYQGWQASSFQDRAACLQKIGEGLLANKDRYARTMSLEMGKLLSEAVSEVEKCAALCQYYATSSETLLSAYVQLLSKPPYEVSISATGVIFGIMPWNFPFWQVFRFLVPNFMLGNVCVLKHAPNVGMCAAAIEELLSLHLPAFVFQNLWADVSQVEHIVSHPAVTGTTITGSEKAGASLASISGKYLKKSVLELGGSDPFIVDRTCDLEHTVQQAILGRLQNNGQTCIAAKRFIIDEAIMPAFKDLLLDQLQHYQYGDPLESRNYAGIMARTDLCQKLLDQVQGALKEGAHALDVVRHIGNSIQPIVLEITNPNNLAFKEELFGPVFVLKSFKTKEEAISLANMTSYGLSASIWSQDGHFIDQFLKETIAGNLFVNALPKSDALTPFGGTQRSGYGRELSVLGLTEFANIKTTFNHNKLLT